MTTMADSITAKDVSELRQRTGAGMMDCKKALEETERRHGQSRRVAAQEGHRARREARRARGVRRHDRAATSTTTASSACWSSSTARPTSSRATTTSRQLAKSIAEHIAARRDRCARRPRIQRSRRRRSRRGALAIVRQSTVERRDRRSRRQHLRRHEDRRAASSSKSLLTRGQSALARTSRGVAASVPTVPMAVTRDDVPATLVDRERRIFSEQAAAAASRRTSSRRWWRGASTSTTGGHALDQPWIRDDSKAIRDLVKRWRRSIRRFARFQIGKSERARGELRYHASSEDLRRGARRRQGIRLRLRRRWTVSRRDRRGGATWASRSAS